MNEIKKSAFSGDITVFENAQRIAGALAKSDIVPINYRNNIPNCLIALDMAGNMNLSPLIVMQNLDIIRGKPSWSSKFLISALRNSPRFSKIEFVMFGERGKDSKGCYVKAFDNELGKEVIGPEVTVAMAKAEGWWNKPNKQGKNTSKWPTMTNLMLQYRAGTFFSRINIPDLTMGLPTSEEAYDTPVVTEDIEIVEEINAEIITESIEKNESIENDEEII